MKHRRRILLAAALCVLSLPLFAGAATALEAEPLPAEPETTLVSEEPTTPVETEPTTEEPTTQEPTTEAPTESHSHTFGDWETTKRATAKKDGVRQRVCSVCGEAQKKTLPRVKSAKLHSAQRVYTGKKVKFPGVTVKDSAGKVLKKGKDYTVRTKNDKNVGVASVILTGKGNYKFTIVRSFRIIPQRTKVTKVIPSLTKATVKWNPVKQSSGYQIRLALDPDFTRGVSVRKVKDGKASSAALTGLKEKTTYYVMVRAFTTVKKKTLVAQWSKAVKFTTPTAAPHAIDGQLPKTQRVPSSYFDDAVFIGDSVSLGLSYYEAAADVLGKAQFLTAGSLGSGNALQPVSEQSVHPRYNGQKMKVEKAVAACGAKKVYIMLGMNDIGAYGVEKSAANFRTLCKRILAESPFVKIYVESVTPRVNQGGKADNVKLNNKNITRYNELLAKICVEEDWYFVNVAETMFDSTGHLKRAYCSDPDGMGMHFSYDGCKAWVDYLYTHTA